LGRTELAADEAGLASSDFVIALGGDGTLLAANRIATTTGVPILGIHAGGPASFGFLTETTPAFADEALASVLAGRYRVDDRLMVRGDIHRGGEVIDSVHALNELVIRAQTRLLKMRVTVGNTFIATYAADGIIVATPTGSTAYNLAAGGPLVHPAIKALLLTPICPHTLNVRSLLVDVEETIHVVIEMGERDVTMLTVDGQGGAPLEPGDEVAFRRNERPGRFISLDPENFYKKVQTRLRLGERFPS
jgi:NAD+ kinase